MYVLMYANISICNFAMREVKALIWMAISFVQKYPLYCQDLYWSHISNLMHKQQILFLSLGFLSENDTPFDIIKCHAHACLSSILYWQISANRSVAHLTWIDIATNQLGSFISLYVSARFYGPFALQMYFCVSLHFPIMIFFWRL